MKLFCLFIAATLSCGTYAQKVKGLNQSTNDTATEISLIIKIERERVKSLVDANITLAQQLHANDFQLITPKGNSLSKEQYLGMIEAGYLKYNWVPGDIAVKLYGNAAVIRYTDKVFQVTVNGKPVDNGRFTHTDLYEKRNEKWQIVWSQASGQNINFPVLDQINYSKKDFTLPNTQEYDFSSAVNGKSYRIFVAFPPAYENKVNDTTRYNVLYVLDGNDEWPLVVENHRLMRASFADKDNPRWQDLIIVGIGYPASTYWSTMPFRASDYTPTHNAMEDSVLIKPSGLDFQTGAASQFIQVLKKEIIAFVDHNFRTTMDRGIIGHSLGAGFAAYILFQETDLFNRYGLLSPNFFRDNNFLLNQELSFAKTHAELPKKIFIARGSQETNAIINSVSQMVDSLHVHHYKGLDVQYSVFPDEMHFSVLPAEISRALQSMDYDPSPVQRKN